MIRTTPFNALSAVHANIYLVIYQSSLSPAAATAAVPNGLSMETFSSFLVSSAKKAAHANKALQITF